MIDLDEIERRANAATPGPWKWDDYSILKAPQNEYVFGVCCDYGGEGHVDVSSEDAIFIAAARSDVPALVAEVRRLRAYIGKIETNEALARREAEWRRSQCWLSPVDTDLS